MRIETAVAVVDAMRAALGIVSEEPADACEFGVLYCDTCDGPRVYLDHEETFDDDAPFVVTGIRAEVGA
jgi:hypothetical protein